MDPEVLVTPVSGDSDYQGRE